MDGDTFTWPGTVCVTLGQFALHYLRLAWYALPILLRRPYTNPLQFFTNPRFLIIWDDTSAMNQSNWMISGARENWRSLLYKESKNIENRRVLFAGDDFENISLLNIDETPLILLTFHRKINDNWSISIGFPIQMWPKILNICIFKNIFQNHLQQKVVEGFLKMWYLEKVDIISFHENLKSFNSYDSSPSYRLQHRRYKI